MESFASLSLEDPACTLQSLISMHNGIIAALTQAQSTQGRLSAEFPSAAHQFQHITGCKRSEALYYLKHVPNNDIRAAVIVWHSQVLKEYLSKYQLPVSCLATAAADCSRLDILVPSKLHEQRSSLLLGIQSHCQACGSMPSQVGCLGRHTHPTCLCTHAIARYFAPCVTPELPTDL